MNRKSIWSDQIKINNPNQLLNNLKVDILIIGAGITGMSTALYLKDYKNKVALIEKDYIGSGITLNTTGKITYMQGNLYSNIIKAHNDIWAYKYLLSQKEACNLVKKTIDKYQIECNYTTNDGYIFTCDDKNIEKIKDIEKLLNKANIKYEIVTSLPNDYKIKYGIKTFDSAVFHPIKYLNSLKDIIKDHISIYEGVQATNIDKKNNQFVVETNKGKIFTNKVIICTHYPFFIKPLWLPLKTYIEKSYLLSLKDKSMLFNAISIDKNHITLRYHQNNLICGGLSHPLSTKGNELDNYNKLQKELKYFLKNEIDYTWTNHDIMTEDSLPIIGEIEDNLFIATGYNKWGMANGTLAGKILSDLVTNKDNVYQKIFMINKKWSIEKVKHLVINISNSTWGMLKNKVNRNKSFYNSNPIIKYVDGKYIGIYYDNDNKKHIVNTICPHMKCSLQFNQIDLTWDCPCHGSRFDIDGNIIVGPSKDNIKIE